MARALTLGNGHMLVGIDERARVRDLYYPYVGLENHVSGASGSYAHRVGVYVDGVLSWTDESTWNIDASAVPGSAVGVFTAKNEALNVTVVFRDVLYNERNIFVRRVSVFNNAKQKRQVKLYFAHQFRIGEDSRGATGFFDPRVHAIVHYKGQYSFLMNALVGKDTTFDDYTIGLFDIEGKEGSHLDAADGMLSKNAIEHGSVDSVMGVTLDISAQTDAEVFYWLAAGSSVAKLHELNQYVIDETPERIHRSAEAYWSAWTYKTHCNMDNICNLQSVEPELRDLFNQSLLIVRAHTDDDGAIIASSDSDILNAGRDTYSYVWPRDAAVAALALDTAGYHDATKSFYRFCADVLEPDGYFMHKYCADGSLGSSWHAWMREGEARLPIQLDETASVIFTLGKHFGFARDLEFIESIYNPFIEKAAYFLCSHLDTKTGLPKDTFDLWEEKYGSSTYTAAATYGALIEAAKLARMLGKMDDTKRYHDVAEGIKKAIEKHLYDKERKMYVKLIECRGGEVTYDHTLDMSSFHGMHYFGVLSPQDKRMRESFKTIQKELLVPGEIGGYMRYENDQYYKTGHESSPNPWFITTLWVAQYIIASAHSADEMAPAKEILWWAKRHALKTGVFPEQIHPETGTAISTTPLVWSHAEFVLTLHAYTKKIRDLPNTREISDKRKTVARSSTYIN